LAVEYTRLSDDHEAFAASIGSLTAPTANLRNGPGTGARIYGALMSILGPIYRWAKRQSFGGAVVRLRDRVRASLGYRRVEPTTREEEILSERDAPYRP
jgi:hypothetical protein